MAWRVGARTVHPMKTFLIEREIPGAQELTDDQLREITAVSNEAVASLNKTDNADVIREHASAGNFPANLVVEVAAVFDSTGQRDLPH